MIYNKIMAEGKQNTGTKASSPIGTHCFLLKRADSSKQSFVQVDFSPVKDQPALLQTSTIPLFNADSRYFTPSFTLPLEQNKIERNLEIYLRIHQERVQEMSLEKEELFVPCPSRSNSYCCICKAPFDDYLTHVNIPAHQTLLRASPFQNDIRELTLSFQPPCAPCPLAKQPSKTQRIRKAGKKGKEQMKLSGCNSSSTACLDQIFQEKAQGV